MLINAENQKTFSCDGLDFFLFELTAKRNPAVCTSLMTVNT